MARLRVHNFTISLDGFAAGPNQREDAPLGDGGLRLHEWIFETDSWRTRTGVGEGATEGAGGINDAFVRAATEGIGATIMGRNMFGPVRGPWTDEAWKGWWGDDPPFEHDVFVLTHHPRASLEMRNGTTFHFVDGPPGQVLGRALESAAGRDVVLGGGASTIRQFLSAGLVDEMHIAIAPVLLGEGERLFEDLAAGIGPYECRELTASGSVAHACITRTRSPGQP